MSADADDLLERAARAQDRDIPTIDEVKADLAVALDKLERQFPDGEPSRDDIWPRLKYRNLMSRITHCRWQLENGQCVEFPRERRSRLERSEDEDSWEMFLEDHPELARTAQTFTDDEILAALQVAIDRRTQPWLQGAVCSADVVSVLLADGVPPAKSQASLIGKQFARMAGEGKVVRFRRKWTKGRGGSIWSLPGLEIADWWLKQYEVDDA